MAELYSSQLQSQSHHDLSYRENGLPFRNERKWPIIDAWITQFIIYVISATEVRPCLWVCPIFKNGALSGTARVTRRSKVQCSWPQVHTSSCGRYLHNGDCLLIPDRVTSLGLISPSWEYVVAHVMNIATHSEELITTLVGTASVFVVVQILDNVSDHTISPQSKNKNQIVNIFRL